MMPVVVATRVACGVCKGVTDSCCAGLLGVVGGTDIVWKMVENNGLTAKIG